MVSSDVVQIPEKLENNSLNPLVSVNSSVQKIKKHKSKQPKNIRTAVRNIVDREKQSFERSVCAAEYGYSASQSALPCLVIRLRLCEHCHTKKKQVAIVLS